VTLLVLQNLAPLALARQSMLLPLEAVQAASLVPVLVPQQAQPADNQRLHQPSLLRAPSHQ
jgi:hypothetical protein